MHEKDQIKVSVSRESILLLFNGMELTGLIFGLSYQFQDLTFDVTHCYIYVSEKIKMARNFLLLLSRLILYLHNILFRHITEGKRNFISVLMGRN